MKSSRLELKTRFAGFVFLLKRGGRSSPPSLGVEFVPFISPSIDAINRIRQGVSDGSWNGFRAG